MPFDLNASYITATEAKLGLALPAEYRACMVRANGGCVDVEDEVWWLYPIFDDSDRKRLKRTCNDILYETSEARSRTGFPQTALAIASNGSGDLLVFLPDPVQAKFSSVVHRWDHETAELEVVAERFD